MNFSRFYKYALLFFLFYLQVNTARPFYINDSALNIGQPLIFEIPRIPQPCTSFYTSLFVDKGNRLFITTDQDLFIYNGVIFQQIETPRKPIISANGKGEIAIAGDCSLSMLTLDKSGGYRIQHIIDSSTRGFQHQITSLGFNDENIYFSTGSKLWVYREKLIPIDSSSQTINIYSTTKGLVFYSTEKGFYKIFRNTIISLSPANRINRNTLLTVVAIEDNLVAITRGFPWFFSISENNPSLIDRISKHLSPDETIQNISAAGSYLFISTATNTLLIYDLKGQLLSRIINFGNSDTASPIDICTSDEINFFAITPTQIFRFINPRMVHLFDYNTNLPGKVNATIKFNNNLYTATSSGLYMLEDQNNNPVFSLIKVGDFEALIQYQNQIFAAGSNGLYNIKGKHLDKLTSELLPFKKTSFTETNPPKAIFLNSKGVYYANLNPPFSLHEIRNNTPFSFIDFFNSEKYLILRSANQQWYSYNFDGSDSSGQNGLISLPPTPNHDWLIIDRDTLTIKNNHLVKVKSAGINAFVGRTFSDQPIISQYSIFHPNFQTLSIEGFRINGNYSNPKSLIAIRNDIEVNAAFLDSDSCLWLSTSKGLISISSEFTKSQNRSYPSTNIFSISTVGKNVNYLIYNDSVSKDSKSKSEYIIEQGVSFEVVLSGTDTYTWDNLTYSVNLDGSKSKWTAWSTNQRYTINNLRAGIHTFNAKVRDPYGFESPELRLTINVVPNFFQTKFIRIALIILFALIFFTSLKWRNFDYALERFKLESIINRRTEELIKEKEKTDNLLARVLPRETANELKETGKVNTQKFNMVTVLFSDIQGFTKITDELNPENLIDQLDKFFLYFDSVVDKYRIEKIKTIGDAYMCAGGIPQKNRTNPVEVVLAALEMLYYMREINLTHNPGQNIWDLRIGIDTGPVIAGVVGRNKLTYDIWGTTVNTASRMESSGEIGKINISGNTYMLVQDYFLCTYRGMMPIKNKGDIEMYFVEGIKPELSTNFVCFKPNPDFLIQLQFLRFGDLEEFILEKLEKGLPKNLYYHNLKHTVDVYTQVELIGRSEKVSTEEQLLLQTAALFHDAGHLIDYDTHEEMGVKLAREILPKYLYSERQIETISDLILITKLPPQPKNLLEAIMCDADLDYLGRTDFIPVSNTLYKELHEHGRIGTIQEWNEMQLKFIEKHQYFTNTARRLRNVNKNSQLENIKRWIEKNKL